MTDRMIPMPASLIEELRAWEQAARTASVGGINNLDSIIRDMEALLSQQEPSAEPVSPRCLFGHDALTAGGHCRRCGAQVVDPRGYRDEPKCICNTGPDTDGPDIECPVHGLPPRIEDLAPGTTFTMQSKSGSGPWRVMVCRSRSGELSLVDSTCGHWGAAAIDPSTIRDVTPPKDVTA